MKNKPHIYIDAEDLKNYGKNVKYHKDELTEAFVDMTNDAMVKIRKKLKLYIEKKLEIRNVSKFPANTIVASKIKKIGKGAHSIGAIKSITRANNTNLHIVGKLDVANVLTSERLGRKRISVADMSAEASAIIRGANNIVRSSFRPESLIKRTAQKSVRKGGYRIFTAPDNRGIGYAKNKERKYKLLFSFKESVKYPAKKKKKGQNKIFRPLQLTPLSKEEYSDFIKDYPKYVERALKRKLRKRTRKR